MRSWCIVILSSLILASCNSISNPQGIYKDIKSALKNKRNAKFLSISGQSSIDPDIKHLVNLKVLYTDNNSYVEIPKEIQNLKTLEWLTIKEYRMPNIFSRKSYEEDKNLKREPIIIPDEIGRLPNLQRLAVSPAKNIPESVSNLKKLEFLQIWGEDITEIPASIGELENLKNLVIWGNYTTIPSSIGNLKKLQHLTLVGNFKQIPKEIALCEELKELTIASPNISSIPLEILNNYSLNIDIIGYAFIYDDRSNTTLYLEIPRGYKINCHYLHIRNFKELVFKYNTKEPSSVEYLHIVNTNIDASIDEILSFAGNYGRKLKKLSLPKISDLQKKKVSSKFEGKQLNVTVEDNELLP